MKCSKKTFNDKQSASTRAKEINDENGKTKFQNQPLRAYRCPSCNKFHLTSITKFKFRIKSDVNFRNEIRENKFIKIEADYWERKLIQ